MRLLRMATLLLVALILVAPSRALAAPLSILVVAEAESSYPAFQQEMAGLRLALENAPGEVIYYIEHLASFRFREPGFRARLGEWLRWKYRGVRIDLILAQGGEGVLFVHENRANWPGVPVVFFEVTPPIHKLPSINHSTGITYRPDVPGNVRLVRRLLPQTKTIALIAGASPVERTACAIIGNAIRDAGGVGLLDLCGLPMKELLHRVSTLPEDVVGFFLVIVVDGAGTTFIAAEVAAHLASAANRPVFGIQSTYMGKGVMGGVVIDFGLIGKAAGEVALRVLRGDDPDAIPTRMVDTNRMVIDARQLERWGIDRKLVPPEAEMLFVEPTLWQTHGRLIFGALTAIVVQALVIGGLLLERRRRREAQMARSRAKELQDQIAHLNRVASLGELAGTIAHELGQPLGAITNNAHATLTLLDRGGGTVPEVREGVNDIAQDAARAAKVLDRVRSYMRRSATEQRLVSVAQIADEVARLLGSAAARRGVTLIVKNASDLPFVLGDEVQLLQVALNLASNAVEAVAAGANGRLVVIRTSRTAGHVELGVEDSGPGVPPNVVARIFEPFFTTKPGGLGMGLAICQTIVQAHGGRIWVDRASQGGAWFRFVLPVAVAAPASDAASSSPAGPRAG
jgi:signal transduction histidine kinase